MAHDRRKLSWFKESRWGIALSWLVLFLTTTPFAQLSAAEELPPAPADIQELIDAGKVEIKFYNPDTDPRRFLGETKYDYSFRHQFQVNYEQVPKTGNPKGAKVVLRDVSYMVKIKHLIHLPESYNGPDIWKRTLTQHEFDHVALSMHPRVDLLLAEVYTDGQQMDLSLPRGQELTSDWVTQEVGKILTERAQAVFSMIPQNNKQLDRLTKHGIKKIEDRAAYFDSLYLKANLDENGFPFTGDFLSLLKSESYREAQPVYLP